MEKVRAGLLQEIEKKVHIHLGNKIKIIQVL